MVAVGAGPLPDAERPLPTCFFASLIRYPACALALQSTLLLTGLLALSLSGGEHAVALSTEYDAPRY